MYDLRRRNCISFIADLARVAGLRTAAEPSMKPGTFLEATAALNPQAAWRDPELETPAPALETDRQGSPPVSAVREPAAGRLAAAQ